MKALNLDCSCGMNGCTTTFLLEEDSEKKENIIIRIVDDKHEYASFISMNKEDVAEVIKRLKTKYKGL